MPFTTLLRIFFLSVSFLLISCQEKPKVTEADLLFTSLQTDQIKWWQYHKRNIFLSSDFLPLGETGDTLSKKAFLEALVTGDYIAIKKKSEQEVDPYQLFKLTSDADENIKYTISAESYREYKHFLMEGQDFPEFRMTDLNGNVFSKEELKGKTVAIKTWFINCKPCIEEMPQLNALVNEYQNRDDVVFLSLALDEEEDLQNFLLKTKFDYPVVPLQKAFIEDTLGLSVYPTHIIVAPSGKILKVVNTAPEMISALKGTMIEFNSNITAPPPPPPPPPPAEKPADYSE